LVFGFFSGWGSDCPGGYAGFIPGVTVGATHVAYLLTCWSTSPRQVRSWCLAAWEPYWFFSVMWYGEALCALEVQGVGGLLFLGHIFLPSVAPASLQHFSFMELMLYASSL
jgi:hypothetical protein